MQLGAWGIGLIGGVLSACVGAQAPRPQVPQYGGDARAAACMEVLPSLDVHPEALSEAMRMARLLSADSLELSLPVAPDHASASELTDWSERRLKDWLKEKARRAQAAREQLDLAASNSPRERILAGALLGLVFEDVARSLLMIPPPSELDSEPEIADVFREVLAKQAHPYLVHAHLAYQACAANALSVETMAHWSDFCYARREELPEQDALDSVRVEVASQ